MGEEEVREKNRWRTGTKSFRKSWKYVAFEACRSSGRRLREKERERERVSLYIGELILSDNCNDTRQRVSAEMGPRIVIEMVYKCLFLYHARLVGATVSRYENLTTFRAF